MKRFPLYMLAGIPVLLLVYIWLFTFAFGLMRAQSDLSVFFGVVILFSGLLSVAILIHYIKNKYY